MSYVDKQGRRVGNCGHYLRPIGPDVYRCDECDKSADELIAALRALALENARLKGLYETAMLNRNYYADERKKGLERIGELEAERDSLKIAETHHHEEFARVEAERDAIRAKTIDEGEKALEAAHRKIGYLPLAAAIKAIRALAQTDRKPYSGADPSTAGTTNGHGVKGLDVP